MRPSWPGFWVLPALLAPQAARACWAPGAEKQWIKDSRLIVIGRVVDEKWQGNATAPGAKGTAYLRVERVVLNRVSGRTVRAGDVIRLPIERPMVSTQDVPPLQVRALWLLEQPDGHFGWTDPKKAAGIPASKRRRHG